MKYKIMALACLCAATAAAQADLGSYLGPGILTHGAGDIGTRGGQEVNFRFYANLTGIYDNGLQPLAVNSQGQLLQVGGLYGVEAELGAYGTHSWKTALLGLDYRGVFRHYDNNSYYDGSDHTLLLGYTYQKSRRLLFDFQELGGTYSQALGSIPGTYLPIPSVVNQPTSLLFDNREYFGQSSASATYLLTARTSFTVGADGYLTRYHAAGLVGMNGYSLRGALQHRLSRVTTIGAEYAHQHFQYPGAFGQADINTYAGVYGTQIGRHWTLSVQAGLYQAEVRGLEQVALSPSIAALLGISSVTQTFYTKQTAPFGRATLSRQFKNAVFTLYYTRWVAPGNGVYLTSRSENAGGSLEYTGIHRWSFGINAGETSLSSLGQGLQGYRQLTGGADLTYMIGRDVHLTAQYYARHQDIMNFGYRRTSDRVAVGIAFSPGAVPLSLW